jgi:site-specific DNA-methyltransferase (adenine-specific)
MENPIVTEKYTLFQGDCLEYMKSMPDKSVDAVITDPPYCVGTTSNGRQGSWLDNNLVLPFFNLLLDDVKRLIKPDGEIYIFTDWRTYPFIFYPISQRLQIKNLIVWDYGWIKAGSHYRFTHEFIIYILPEGHGKRKYDASQSDVWRMPPINFTAEKNHPTEKPVDVIARMLQNSAPVDSVVFDPFMGSGTTGVACMQLGRRFIGCEIDPGYFEIARKRIEAAAAQMLLPGV